MCAAVNSYSAGAAGVILPHVLGPMESVSRRNVTWEQVAEHSEVVLAFGGMALKNSMVAGGGISKHIERGSMQAAAARGCALHRRRPAARRHAGGGAAPSGWRSRRTPTPR